MAKYMVIGDCHLTDPERAPLNRKGHWTEELFAKLEFIVELAKKNKCDAILQNGDLYHLPSYSANSVALIQRTHDVLTSAGIPVIIVPGNHELRHLNVDDDLPKHALGALGRMEGIELISKQSSILSDVYGIPYLQDWSTLPTWIDEYNTYREEHPEIERGIIITHASLFPRKDEPIYDFIADEDLADMLKYPTTVMHGHLHFSQGARTYDEVEIINYGAISRGSLHKETINRKPQVYIYNTATGKHKTYNIPVKPPEEVFILEPHELEKERTEKLTEFLSGLDTDSTGVVTSVEQMVEHVTTTQDVSSDVKVLVSELLDFAQEK